MTAASREDDLVELVMPDGTPAGSATVDAAHQAPGHLHRAFSVFLRDPAGRVLLQQRAAVKTRFPLRWGNTCCGHPAPGEDVTVAAARRLHEEIGLDGAELTPVGVYSYYAEDPDSGRVEYEYDHVLLGDLPPGAEPRPDPDEVADLAWVSVPDLQRMLAENPRGYAPWLAGVTECLAKHLAGGSSRDGSDGTSAPLAGPVLSASAFTSGVGSSARSGRSYPDDASSARSGGPHPAGSDGASSAGPGTPHLVGSDGASSGGLGRPQPAGADGAGSAAGDGSRTASSAGSADSGPAVGPPPASWPGDPAEDIFGVGDAAERSGGR
jgi:isopentenyl-diphosphate delta-isomerase